MRENGSEGEWKDPPARHTVRARTKNIGQHWTHNEDSGESMTSKTPSQGGNKTNSSRNSFDVLTYNNEDEDYDDVNNDEVDMYTFEVNTLTNNITMEQMIHNTNTKKYGTNHK
jgi:hypothetical protein